jgi:hypothetical protein
MFWQAGFTMYRLSPHTRTFGIHDVPNSKDEDFLFLVDGSFEVWANVRLRVKWNIIVFWDRPNDVMRTELIHPCFDFTNVESVVASLAVCHRDFLNRCGIEVDLDSIQKIEALELPQNFDGC